MFDMPLRLLFLFAFSVGTACAAPPVPGFTREQTLNQDFLGPRVEWHGEIVGMLRDDDDTCFILVRLDDGFGYDMPGNRFVACQPGLFDPAQFAPGRILQVIGNLGAAMPRSIGGQTLDYPLVAGAIVQPDGWRRPYWPPRLYPDPFYPYYPYYDPFWRPWPYRPWPY